MEGSAFRFQYEVPVRFKDVDIGGHAHHSHALVYFEEARAAYWREVLGQGGLEDVDYILAEASIRYKARILWPQLLRVGVRVSRLGKRHFEMTYEVRGDAGDLLVTGATVQVMYDYAKGKTKALTGELRDAISEWDGPFGPGGVPLQPDG